jgi:hypothetical protein
MSGGAGFAAGQEEMLGQRLILKRFEYLMLDVL